MCFQSLILEFVASLLLWLEFIIGTLFLAIIIVSILFIHVTGLVRRSVHTIPLDPCWRFMSGRRHVLTIVHGPSGYNTGLVYTSSTSC